MEILLASASPRRRELLARILPRFGIFPARGEERADLSLPPGEIAKALARAKAAEISALRPDALVLGADTVVYHAGRLLGKPHDAEEAKRTLRALSGQAHEVYTGYCLRGAGRELCGAVCSRVFFRVLSEEYIGKYVAGGSPLDKAGSYGIQDEDGPVARYEGSFTNIVGLPVEKVREAFAAFGVIK